MDRQAGFFFPIYEKTLQSVQSHHEQGQREKGKPENDAEETALAAGRSVMIAHARRTLSIRRPQKRKNR